MNLRGGAESSRIPDKETPILLSLSLTHIIILSLSLSLFISLSLSLSLSVYHTFLQPHVSPAAASGSQTECRTWVSRPGSG